MLYYKRVLYYFKQFSYHRRFIFFFFGYLEVYDNQQIKKNKKL